MNIYHVTTPSKIQKCRNTGHIRKPVRGFENPQAALVWMLKTGRTLIYEINCTDASKVYKLPDHHNHLGEAYWYDNNVAISDMRCVFSKNKAERFVCEHLHNRPRSTSSSNQPV